MFLSILVAGQDKGGGKNAERVKALTARQRNFGARGPVRAARTALGRSVIVSARVPQYPRLRRPKIGPTQIHVGIVMSVIFPLLCNREGFRDDASKLLRICSLVCQWGPESILIIIQNAILKGAFETLVDTPGQDRTGDLQRVRLTS